MASAIQVDWLEDSSATIMCRIEGRPLGPGQRGAPLLAASFSAISYSVVDITDPAVPVVVTGHNAIALVPATVISSGLEPWHVDDVGHNFRHTIAASPNNPFPTGKNRYEVEVKWTLTDGMIGHTRWDGPAHPLYAS